MANATEKQLENIDLLPKIKHKTLITPELGTMFSDREDKLKATRRYKRLHGNTPWRAHVDDIRSVQKILGRPIISLNGVTDPTGLKCLTLSVKKALYPKKELERWMTGIRSDNLSIIRNISVCLRCGTKNAKDTSFCSKCGSILK